MTGSAKHEGFERPREQIGRLSLVQEDIESGLGGSCISGEESGAGSGS
jgi:hypothetical protein